jgi:hypothetical protein
VSIKLPPDMARIKLKRLGFAVPPIERARKPPKEKAVIQPKPAKPKTWQTHEQHVHHGKMGGRPRKPSTGDPKKDARRTYLREWARKKREAKREHGSIMREKVMERGTSEVR